MGTILLLYDTKENDLAKDFRELFAELGVELTMIATSPSKGKTLQGKEHTYFESSTAAIFLITPRSGSNPSPSVSAEIGWAEEKFKRHPERVVYLVENNCTPPTIIQRAYIQFVRSDMRKVLQALTEVIKELKQIGILATRGLPQTKKTPSPPAFVLPPFMQGVPAISDPPRALEGPSQAIDHTERRLTNLSDLAPALSDSSKDKSSRSLSSLADLLNVKKKD